MRANESPAHRAPVSRTLALVLALALALGGCASLPHNSQEVNVESSQVTERDLEVARQMQAPEQLIQSLEQGEWLYPSDREAVRFAELALDHMQDAYGQECRATWSTVPWVLDTNATVTLVAVGGEYDGAEVEVVVSASSPHTFTDTWYQVRHQSEYKALVEGALNAALADLPADSWAFSTSLTAPGEAPEDAQLTDLEEAFGDVSLYLLSTQVPDVTRLEELRQAVLAELEKTGVESYVGFFVLDAAQVKAPFTSAEGKAAVKAGAALMTDTGVA